MKGEFGFKSVQRKPLYSFLASAPMRRDTHQNVFRTSFVRDPKPPSQRPIFGSTDYAVRTTEENRKPSFFLNGSVRLRPILVTDKAGWSTNAARSFSDNQKFSQRGLFGYWSKHDIMSSKFSPITIHYGGNVRGKGGEVVMITESIQNLPYGPYSYRTPSLYQKRSAL